MADGLEQSRRGRHRGRSSDRGDGSRQRPGEELIRAGLEDLARGEESIAALLVSVGAPRLQRLGHTVTNPIPDAEHRLYERLRATEPGSAHSRYNALGGRSPGQPGVLHARSPRRCPWDGASGMARAHSPAPSNPS